MMKTSNLPSYISTKITILVTRRLISWKAGIEDSNPIRRPRQTDTVHRVSLGAEPRQAEGNESSDSIIIVNSYSLISDKYLLVKITAR